jgi:hypothetical protein
MRQKYAILIIIIACLWAGAASAQWTIPDSTRCPQPGPGAESPWISNDNLRLYMSSMATVCVFSRPSQDSAWGPMTLIPRINLEPTQRCPAVSPSGDTLYFVGDPRSDCDENYGSWDIYYTIRTGPCDTCWGPVHNAGPNVNTNRREYSVGISRDGNILLTSSTRGGRIDPHLYWHEKQVDGSWGLANIFPPEINDMLTGEEHPCLSPDNNRLYYSHRDVLLGDVYISEKVNGVWQMGVPLPSPPVNWPQVSADEDPCLAMDGRTLWFRQAPYPGYDYHIMVTVDTSIEAVSPRTIPVVTSTKPTLAVINDASGVLRLAVSGVALRGDHQIQVHDILGRLVGQYHVSFNTDGQTSFGALPSLMLTSGTFIVSIRLPARTLSATFHRTD